MCWVYSNAKYLLNEAWLISLHNIKEGNLLLLFLLRFLMYSPYWINFSFLIASCQTQKILLLPLPKEQRLPDGLVLAECVSGRGLAMGYRQNSCPSNANDDSWCRFFASVIVLGRVSCTGSSSLQRIVRCNIHQRWGMQLNSQGSKAWQHKISNRW